MSEYRLPLPDTEDEVSAPFWAATRDGRLSLQRCDACGYVRYPPSRYCPECLSDRATWAEIEPAGTLYSHTTYRRAMDGRFKGVVPYAIGYVELDAGPRMVGVLEVPAEQITVGMRLRGTFDPVTPDVTLIRWTAA